MTSAILAIVDDDKPFAEYLQTMLRSRGYETMNYQKIPNGVEPLPV